MQGRIVFAEDDATLAYAIGHALERAGYDVAVFNDSIMAWDDLKSDRRPALLLTDMRFPASTPSGLALANHARTRHPLLPVIFMTGYRELGELIDRGQYGPVLFKPIDATSLMPCIRRLVA